VLQPRVVLGASRDALLAEFGREADIERLDLLEQVFGGRMGRAIMVRPSHRLSDTLARRRANHITTV